MATLNQNVGAAIDNPYVGPRTFSTEEAHLFFGREREARALIALIISERLVLFYSQSGAGKSSLMNARLIPGLAQEGFEILPVGRVSGVETEETAVENIFVYNLIASLHQGPTLPAGSETMSLCHFLDNLAFKDGRFLYDDNYTYTDGEEIKPRVLLIDQFEEILTTNTAYWQHRDGFFQQLRTALLQDEQLWVVFSMREDFVAGLDLFLDYLPTNLRNRYYMQRLDRDAALEAITRPARQAGRPFTKGAAELLVDNLQKLRLAGKQETDRLEQYVEPVQLQAVCYQMWERLKSDPASEINCDHVLAFGDVDAALINFYEETIADTIAQTGVSEVSLRNWFDTALITEMGSRNMVFRGLETTGDIPTAVADHVRDRFILREINRPGGVWYELVHDRFVQPIQDSNRAWRLDQPLPRLAQQWEDAGRSKELLLGYRELKRLSETNWRALGWLVTEFVNASQAARQEREDARTAERQIAQQREMEQQRALAETQRQRAEEAEVAKVRQSRLATLATALAFAGLLVALMAAFFGFQASDARGIAEMEATQAAASKADAETKAAEAVEAQAAARAAEGEAQANLATATVALQEAMAAEARAKEARAEANALLLVDKTEEFLERGNLDGALLLGHGAILSKTNASSQGALFQVLNTVADQTQGSYYYPDSTDAVEAFRRELPSEGINLGPLFRGPEQGTLATMDDGKIIWWDTQESTLLTHTIHVSVTFEQAAFSSDSNQTLLATAEGSALRLWRMENDVIQELGRPVLETEASIKRIAFSLDDTRLAIALCPPEGSRNSSTDSSCALVIWEIGNERLQNKKEHPISVTEIEDLVFTSNALIWSSPTKIGVFMLSEDSSELEMPPQESVYYKFGPLAYVESENWLVVGGSCQNRDYCDDDQDGFLRWWSLSEGVWLAPSNRMAAPVNNLVYLPLPQQQGVVVASNGEGDLLQWQTSITQWLDLTCQITGRNLTAEEWLEVFPTSGQFPITCPNFEEHITVTEWRLDEAERLLRNCNRQDLGLARQQHAEVRSTEIEPFDIWAPTILLDEALRSDRDFTFRKCAQLTIDLFEPLDIESFFTVWAEIYNFPDHPDEQELAHIPSFYESHRQELESNSQVTDTLDRYMATFYEGLCTSLELPEGRTACTQYYEHLNRWPGLNTGFITLTPTARLTDLDRWTFRGNAGDFVTVAMNALDGGNPILKLFDSEMKEINYYENNNGDQNYTIHLSLPEDGDYFVEARWFDENEKEAYTLAVTRVEPKILEFGAIVETNGEENWWQFEGQVGTFVTITMDTLDDGIPYLELIDSHNNKIAGDDDGRGRRDSQIQWRLPEDGTYYINAGWLDNPSRYSISVDQFEPASISFNETVESNDGVGWWQFEGQQGDVVTIAMDALENGDPYLYLFDVDGAEISRDDDGGEGLNSLILFPIPADGIYYINAGWFSNPGRYSLEITNIEFELLEIGETVEANDEQQWWQFEGHQGDFVAIAMDALEGGIPFLQLLDEQNNTITLDDQIDESVSSFIRWILPEDGTYYIDAGWLDNPGPYTLSVDRYEPPIITINETIEGTAEDEWWQFEGQQGDIIAIAMDAVESGDSLLRLFDMSGNQISTNDDGGDGLNSLIHFPLPADGIYYIDAGWYDNPGHYTLLVTTIDQQDNPSTAATALKEGALYAVRQGLVEEALAFLEEAQSLDETLTISAENYNTICWFGALWNFAAQVLSACEEAVALEPEHGGIADSRGVARAMTGDFEGAIEDFQFFIEWNGFGPESDLRQQWIEELEAGRNPFEDESLLEQLRNG